MKIDPHNQFKKIIHSCRSTFWYVFVYSLLINILMLTVPFYMLQIFDRVLSSQNTATLIYLTIIAIIALFVLALLDITRGRMMSRAARWIDEQTAPLCLVNSVDNILLGGNYGRRSLADINIVRQYLSSSSVFGFFDLPWIIIYLFVIYMLSWVLGVLATVGAIILLIFVWLNEFMTRQLTLESNQEFAANQVMIDGALSDAENTKALGMLPIFSKLWNAANETALGDAQSNNDRSIVIISAAKFIRMVLQILILGVGAYLVMLNDITAGGMIAASIIMARALAPIEQIMGSWRNFLNAQQAYYRLQSYLKTPAPIKQAFALPNVSGSLQVEDLAFAPQEKNKPILQGIRFNLPAGKMLAIIGPSGAGKSTLARMLVGIWPPSFGSVRLDGEEVYHWQAEEFAKVVGFSSEAPSLYAGTVAENIARFHDVDERKIVEAAELVNVHHHILHLPQGYETNTVGYQITMGMRQRIVLARAFFGNPKLVVLDEPENYLDQDGLLSLENAIKQAKARHITVVLITQRPQLARYADHMMVLNQGRIQSYGDPENIIKVWQGNKDA